MIVNRCRVIGSLGVQDIALFTKGLTSKSNGEATIDNLASLSNTFCHKNPIMDPSDRGILLNLVSLVPYLLSEFDKPSDRAIRIATTLATACEQTNLANIGKLLLLYSRNQFSKGEEQWTDDTSRYIHEVFPLDQNLSALGLLFAMLETGHRHHSQILRLTGSLLRCLDRVNANSMNGPAMVMMRALQGDYWKDALNVMDRTLCVWLPNEDHKIVLDSKNPPRLSAVPKPADSDWNDPLASQERTRKRLIQLVNTMRGVTTTVDSKSVTFKKRTLNSVRKKKSLRRNGSMDVTYIYTDTDEDEDYDDDFDDSDRSESVKGKKTNQLEGIESTNENNRSDSIDVKDEALRANNVKAAVTILDEFIDWLDKIDSPEPIYINIATDIHNDTKSIGSPRSSAYKIIISPSLPGSLSKSCDTASASSDMIGLHSTSKVDQASVLK
eukprot:Ihof_evm3s48 gene=Ihof_evmTU3s48